MANIAVAVRQEDREAISEEEPPISTKMKEDIENNSTCHHKQSFKMATRCTMRSIPISQEELFVSRKIKEDIENNSTYHQEQSFKMAMRCTMRSIPVSQEELPV
eukprot:7428093-Ditylum_brightwellii.AAC.1